MIFIVPPLTVYLERGGMDFARPAPQVYQIAFDFAIVFLLAAMLLFFITRDIAFHTRQNNVKRFILTTVIGSMAISSVFAAVYYFYEMSDLHRPATGFLAFKILSISILSVLTACIIRLMYRQKQIEVENEQLRTENIQNRFDALSAQINPHFIFNSLNSLAALVRDERNAESLKYIGKLSDIFRYVLKNRHQELVTLREEIGFINAYRFLLEIRYEDKLRFSVRIPDESLEKHLPSVSLQPVVENVVKHNVINKDNPLTISIFTTDDNELAVSNPIQKKIDADSSFGIGLENLSSRYQLIAGKDIGISFDNQAFTVKLPLM
jgi:sensor histidine kinase YesM